MAKPKTLVEKILDKLTAGGLSPRKATELAKSIAPMARRAVKKELETAFDNEGIEEAISGATVPSNRAPSPATASAGSVLPVIGAKGATLLQTIMGLTTGPSYRVVAVKGEEGLVAAKNFYGEIKLKFYPDMQFWGFSYGRLVPLGASRHVTRDQYERAMFTEAAAKEVLERINAEGQTHKGRKLADRMKAVAYHAFQQALHLLQ
jgi:hypothetical protein